MLFKRFFYDADAQDSAPVADLTISVTEVEEGEPPVTKKRHGYDVLEIVKLTESNQRVTDEKLLSWAVGEYAGAKLGLVFFEGGRLFIEDKAVFGLIADMNTAKLIVTNMKNVAAVVEFIFNVVNPSMDATCTQWVHRMIKNASEDEDKPPMKGGGEDESA